MLRFDGADMQWTVAESRSQSTLSMIDVKAQFHVEVEVWVIFYSSMKVNYYDLGDMAMHVTTYIPSTSSLFEQCIISDNFINCLKLTSCMNLLNISQNSFLLIIIEINFERCLINHGRHSSALWDSIHNRPQSIPAPYISLFLNSPQNGLQLSI